MLLFIIRDELPHGANIHTNTLCPSTKWKAYFNWLLTNTGRKDKRVAFQIASC